jgi:hypothetical protein
MSNSIAITTPVNEVTFTRTLKSGKDVTRGLMGLMTSGNKAERISAADMLIHQQWATGQFKPMARELVRIFGTKRVMEDLSLLGVNVFTPAKKDVVALLDGVVRMCHGKVVKGEKAVYLAYAVDLLAKHAAAESLKLSATTSQAALTS